MYKVSREKYSRLFEDSRAEGHVHLGSTYLPVDNSQVLHRPFLTLP
jgi:hypothetical protein